MDLRGLLCLRRRQGGYRASRGRRGRGVEEALVEEDEDDGENRDWDARVELHTVLDSEAKAPLLNGEPLAT